MAAGTPYHRFAITRTDGVTDDAGFFVACLCMKFGRSKAWLRRLAKYEELADVLAEVNAKLVGVVAAAAAAADAVIPLPDYAHCNETLLRVLAALNKCKRYHDGSYYLLMDTPEDKKHAAEAMVSILNNDTEDWHRAVAKLLPE